MFEKLASLFDILSSPRIFLLDYAALSGNSWIHDEGEESNKVEKYFQGMGSEEKGK